MKLATDENESRLPNGLGDDFILSRSDADVVLAADEAGRIACELGDTPLTSDEIEHLTSDENEHRLVRGDCCIPAMAASVGGLGAKCDLSSSSSSITVICGGRGKTGGVSTGSLECSSLCISGCVAPLSVDMIFHLEWTRGLKSAGNWEVGSPAIAVVCWCRN